jgi:hypothetical protein
MQRHVKELIAEVRRIAAERPDTVYRQPSTSCGCFYEKGECTDGSVGCIFGQALNNLGYPVTGTASIDIIARSRFVGNCLVILAWCREVQNVQDGGLSWGDAIISANTKWPIVQELPKEATCQPSET